MDNKTQFNLYRMAYKRTGEVPPAPSPDIDETQQSHRLQGDLKYKMSQLRSLMDQNDKLEKQYWSKHDPNILQRADPGSEAFREAVYARDAKRGELDAAHVADMTKARGPRWWQRSDLRADAQSPRASEQRYDRYWEKTLARARANRERYQAMQAQRQRLANAPGGMAVAGR